MPNEDRKTQNTINIICQISQTGVDREKNKKKYNNARQNKLNMNFFIALPTIISPMNCIS